MFPSPCGLSAIGLGAAFGLLIAHIDVAHADDCKSRGQLDARYCDEDGDLVADVPKDPKNWRDPSTLVFAYTPVEDPALYQNIFKPFTDYLAQCTGRRVVYYPVQSNAAQIEALLAWREVAPYPEDDAWVFASHRTHGLKPYYPDMILKRHIRPTAKKLGIEKNIGWHTFRRTYSSLLVANKEDVKVVQELLRHATSSMAIGLYAQAFSENARQAQSKIVDMVRNAPLPERPAATGQPVVLNVQ